MFLFHLAKQSDAEKKKYENDITGESIHTKS